MPDDAYKRYLFEYRYENAEWRLEIAARNETEARDRLKALPWAQYQGEVALSISIPHTRLSGVATRIRACTASISRLLGYRT